MRLSRTDLVSLLTIVAGGLIGAALSYGLVGPRTDDAPTEHLLFGPSVPVESVDGQLEAQRATVYTFEQIEALRGLVARAAELVREQRDIVVGMERLVEAREGPGSVAGRSLFERKEAMHDEVADLEQELLGLTGEARAAMPVLLDEVAKAIEDDKLKERVRYSRGLIGIPDWEYMREFEAETTRVVEELLRELEDVVVTLTRTPDEYSLELGSRGTR